MFTPPTQMVPLSISPSLAASLAQVLLPEPEGPTSAVTSPSFSIPARSPEGAPAYHAANVVINIVAGDGIEAFVFKGQTDRISFFKADIGDAFGFRIVLAALLRKDRLVRAGPDIAAHHGRFWIPLRRGDRQCAAAAAYVKAGSAISRFFRT